MDLFVSAPGDLDTLYGAVEASSLAAPGTLTIVRGARVPIVKYIDSMGSGSLALI
jgi:hypothetical protein